MQGKGDVMAQQTGGSGKARDRSTDSSRKNDSAHVNQPSPHIGRPLDGSQYHDVVEEQMYAEERPEQHRRPAPPPRSEHGDDGATSVGDGS
jgi:hypothetical protein